MDHANHAPEKRRHVLKGPVDGRVKANFEYVRVKQSDAGSSASLETGVPLDFTTGITTQLRAYRETAGQDIPSIDYQVVPDGAPLPPRVADESPADDPLHLKRSYIGTITVNVPGGNRRVYEVTTEQGDPVPLDLTKGLNVTCSFQWAGVDSMPMPIGPMLNIDITPAP
ncbi:MAG TPA: hypothetical protein VGC72_18425 [Candidatus Elarobacter sp.]|jgi:hypothetical protein